HPDGWHAGESVRPEAARRVRGGDVVSGRQGAAPLHDRLAREPSLGRLSDSRTENAGRDSADADTRHQPDGHHAHGRGSTAARRISRTPGPGDGTPRKVARYPPERMS